MTTGEIVPITNRGEIGLVPPGAVRDGAVDTEHVIGNPGPASSGTQFIAMNKDTTPAGGSRLIEPVSPPVQNRGVIGLVPPGPLVDGVSDTTGAVGVDNFQPVSTELHKTVNTLNPGQIGMGDADPVYRAPVDSIPVNIRDTTLTDRQPGGSLTNPFPQAQMINGTLETAQIGALNSGTGLNPPEAPSNVQAYHGSRVVHVTWEGPENVENDKTLGYVVKGSTDGTKYAHADQRHVAVDTLDPGRTYTFQVNAVNKAGDGQYSSPSNQSRPYNPDENDVLKPVGLAPENRLEPIYRPDGTIKPGTGGVPL